MTWEVLCKCSGKYIDIYFNLKITFLSSVERVHSTLGGCRSRGFFVR